MKKEQLKELLESNKTEDGFNYDAIAKGINEFANSIRDKHFEKEKEALKGMLSNDVKGEFVKEYGFDNVDQFGAFVDNSKATATEQSKSLERIQKEYADYKEKYVTLEEQYNVANNELSTINNKQIAKKFGVKDDMLDFALFEAQKLTKEDTTLEQVFEGFKESKPSLFQEEQQERFQVGKKPGEKAPPKEGSVLAAFNQLKQKKF